MDGANDRNERMDLRRLGDSPSFLRRASRGEFTTGSERTDFRSLGDSPSFLRKMRDLGRSMRPNGRNGRRD